MGISIHKIGVLFKKDFNDFFKNMAVFVSSIIPVCFAFLYRFVIPVDMGADSGVLISMFLNMILCLNIAMVAVMIPATTIAEEKEKFTLRTLMLSNVKGAEVFTAKLLVTSLLLLITNVIIFLVFGADLSLLPMFIVIVVVGAIAPTLLGMIVGILARDQMNAGVYEIPVMLLLMLPAIFSNMNNTMAKIAAFTPCQPVIQLFTNLQNGELLSGDSLLRAITIVVWIIGASVALIFLYKKRGVDN